MVKVYIALAVEVNNRIVGRRGGAFGGEFREDVKQVATLQGSVLTGAKFEEAVNRGDIETFTESYIVIEEDPPQVEVDLRIHQVFCPVCGTVVEVEDGTIKECGNCGTEVDDRGRIA